jgi:cysteine desulfurase/selenocysteine lyase
VYEAARAVVARFVNARDPLEIVWTRGTTEAINLVATSWGGAVLRPDDEIVLTRAEHASNLLPWRFAAERAGARLRVVDLDDEGAPRLDHLDALLSPRTRLLAFSHVSNVLGQLSPATELCARARAAGARVFVDAAQSVPHVPVDVQALGCDFLAFSSHKMLGPMGTGVLWARRELLDEMPPYQTGSNMAHEAGFDGAIHWSPDALRFGAGTPNVAGPVGLAVAIGFLESIGFSAIREHEQQLTRHALARLTAIPAVRLLGSPRLEGRLAVFSFTVGRRTGPEIVAALDAEGIAVRGGDLASLPLLRHLGVSSAARASCYLYTSHEDIDRLAAALERLVEA